MKVTISQRQFEADQVSVSCRFTEGGAEKVMMIALAEPFETEDVYFEVLEEAVAVDILYQYNRQARYNIDTKNRNQYSVSHTFDQSGESYNISIPVV